MLSNQPMRIALFVDDFFPASGGVTRSVEIQAEALARLGHTVTVFAPRKRMAASQAIGRARRLRINKTTNKLTI